MLRAVNWTLGLSSQNKHNMKPSDANLVLWWVIQGLYWGPIGVILGLYWKYWDSGKGNGSYYNFSLA